MGGVVLKTCPFCGADLTEQLKEEDYKPVVPKTPSKPNPPAPAQPKQPAAPVRQ